MHMRKCLLQKKTQQGEDHKEENYLEVGVKEEYLDVKQKKIMCYRKVMRS